MASIPGDLLAARMRVLAALLMASAVAALWPGTTARAETTATVKSRARTLTSVAAIRSPIPKKSVKSTSAPGRKVKGASAAGGNGKAKKKILGGKAATLPAAGGKVAVFAFRGDDVTMPVHSQVVRSLRNKGLTVITHLRPVDTAVQYRDMAVTLGLAVYVEGEVSDNGKNANAVLRVRSGVTGRRVASARFSSDSRQLVSDIERTLWSEVGGVLSRACVAAAKPRRHANAPLRIEAGTPIENTPRVPQHGT